MFYKTTNTSISESKLYSRHVCKACVWAWTDPSISQAKYMQTLLEDPTESGIGRKYKHKISDKMPARPRYGNDMYYAIESWLKEFLSSRKIPLNTEYIFNTTYNMLTYLNKKCSGPYLVFVCPRSRLFRIFLIHVDGVKVHVRHAFDHYFTAIFHIFKYPYNNIALCFHEMFILCRMNLKWSLNGYVCVKKRK